MNRSIFSNAFLTTLFLFTIGPACSWAENPSDRFGAIEGVVRFLGAVPQTTVPDNAGLRRDRLIVDRETRGLRFAAVYLEAADSFGFDESARPGKIDGDPVVVNQVDLAFRPVVVAIRAGQTVVFTNEDPENHNVRASGGDARNRLNIVTAPDRDFEKRFVAERGVRPIRLSCDIHAWMRGWIYVFEHPHFAVTGRGGEYRIEGLAPGPYRLVVEQPDGVLRAEYGITILEGGTTVLDLEFEPEDLAEEEK